MFGRKPEARPTARQRRRPDSGRPTAFNFSSYRANRLQGVVNTGRLGVADQPVQRHPKPLRRLLRHKRGVLVAVIGLFGLLYNFQLNTTPKVVALSTSSDAPFLRNSATYEQAAASLFAATAANRNKLTVNAAAIASQLKQQFPELQDVSVTLPLFGSQPTVYVQPSSPAAILTSSSGTFVLDETGRAMLAASQAVDVSRFGVPSVIDQSHYPVAVGQPAVAGSTARFIHTVQQQVTAQGLKVSRMVLPAGSSELDVYISGQMYFAKFNLQQAGQGEVLRQAGAFLATQAQLAGQRKTPASYIDVRVAGRAYYK